MVFIPKSTELYNAVKIRLCKDMPTPSQCICVGKNLKDSRKVRDEMRRGSKAALDNLYGQNRPKKAQRFS